MEGRPLEDAELVEKAKQGDSASYAELVRKYQEVAVRTAYFIAGSSEAEDAAQEAFVKAYYALGRFRSGAPFHPWLLRIVANEARNRRRRARRGAEIELLDAADRTSGGATASVEDAVIASERDRSLIAALNRLGEKDRVLIAYRYFLDFSEAEMASLMKTPRGTIKSRLSRAMHRLRAALEQEEGARIV